MDNKVFAYIRVSTKEQHTDRQEIAINEYCKEHNIVINERDIYVDKQSGKDTNRKSYQVLKHQLRKGDTLIVKELDRFSRSMTDIKTEWNYFLSKGVNIIVIDTPMLNTTNKSDLEKTLISNIVFELLSYLAEKERIKIKTRQTEGIKIAIEKGTKFGRTKIEHPTEWNTVYRAWRNKEITAKTAMEKLNLKRTTFYKLVSEYEKQN